MGVLQQTLPLSVLYFSLVFTAGLILGSIRVPYLHPLLGTRYAELFELPIMLVVTWQAAQVTVWNLDAGASSGSGEPKQPPPQPASTASSSGTGKWSPLSLLFPRRFVASPPPTPLLVGALALVWLLAVELAASVVGAGSRDFVMVAGPPVYAVALLAYAVMPLIAWLVQAQRDDADKLLWDFDETQAEQEDYCSRDTAPPRA